MKITQKIGIKLTILGQHVYFIPENAEEFAKRIEDTKSKMIWFVYDDSGNLSAYNVKPYVEESAQCWTYNWIDDKCPCIGYHDYDDVVEFDNVNEWKSTCVVLSRRECLKQLGVK